MICYPPYSCLHQKRIGHPDKSRNARYEAIKTPFVSGRLLFHGEHFARHINGCEQEGVREGCGHGCV